MSESDLLRSIMERLALIPGLLAWRQNTGVAKAHGFRIRFGLVGSGDITGVLPGGRRLEIEVKTPTGRVSPEQIAFGERINKAGGLWFVARSADEAVIRIQEALP